MSRLRIQVYVSYSTVHKKELSAVKASFNLYNRRENRRYQMEIKYSENSLEEGKSIVEFMDEIATAGFVIFLFSKEYFESPFCLYELITAYEKQKLTNRSVILPIKSKVIGNNVGVGELKKIVKEWNVTDIDENCQIELKELLNIDDDSIREKIESVYNNFLKPWFNTLINEKTSKDMINEIEKKAVALFQEEESQFYKMILGKIKNELSSIKNLKDSWENYSTVSLDKNEIAKKLSELSYSDSLLEIQKWARVEYSRKLGDWPVFFKHIQSIAGWVILKSIKQEWWINKKLSYKDGVNNNGFVELCLDEEQFSYSEVVVSRGLENIKPAQFILDEDHNLTPQGKENLIKEDGCFVLDSSEAASLSFILTPMFVDLKRRNPKSDEPKKLLKEIVNIAFGHSEIIFYLVKEEYLKKLKEYKSPLNETETVLDVIKRELKGKLFFIVIDAERDETMLQVADFSKRPLSLIHNILLIDK